MFFIISCILAVLFVFGLKKPLKKYPGIFYITAVIITILVSSVDAKTLPSILSDFILPIFSRGSFSTALWCIVMWTGAFPNGSKPIKFLMPIRAELSIFAAILTLGHNIGYGKNYFTMLFTNIDRMTPQLITASILTIIMLLIMIPLTVISFPQIHKKMNGKLWKKIQRTAYLFYALIYVHVMVLCLPSARMGRDGYLLSIIIYSMVFIGYAVCRIRKYLVVKKKISKATALNVGSAVVLCGFIAGFIVYAQPPKQTEKITAISNDVSETTIVTSVSTEFVSESVTGAIVTSVTSSKSETSVFSETAVSDITQISETDISETDLPEVIEEEINQEEIQEENQIEEEIPVENNNNEEENPPEEEQIPEPEYIYNNGTFYGSAYGYDGNIDITITIENDIITSISGETHESDDWYYNSASESVINQILNNQNTDADAYSGATYSSKAIMEAVQNALNSARK